MSVAIQPLFDIAVNYISSVCTNISNYGAISAEFKPGWAREFYHNRSRAVYAIQSFIGQSNRASVQSQLQSCLYTYGFNDLSKTLSESTITGFYSVIAAFTSARVRLASSQFSNNKYIYYYSDATDYNIDSATILTSDILDILASEGINSSYAIQRIIQRNIKAYSIPYSAAIYGYGFNDGYHPANAGTPAVVY